MLDFQTAAFLNIYEDDGLLIIAKGLGEEDLIKSLFDVYGDSGNLVLVIGSSVKDEDYYMEHLLPTKCQIRRVTSEINANERKDVYADGGILFLTSRILVVDLLKSNVPVAYITGIVVLNAHRVLDSSAEAFILRLYREKNKTGFIKAISDNPEAFTRGFCKVENVMKNLFAKKLFLWPRFQAIVQSSLEINKPRGTEIQVRLTPSMLDIHSAILDLIVNCVRDLKKNNTSLDLEEVTTDIAVHKAFDKIVKFQLEPIWHQLSTITKQLINDLKELRCLLINLTQYDCVTFFKSIQSLSTNESVLRNPGWIFLPAFSIVFDRSKERVYGPKKKVQTAPETTKKITSEADLLLEKSPKWLALEEILIEILDEMKKTQLHSGAAFVLIVAQDDRTCDQLKEVLCEGSKKTLFALFNRYMNSSDEAEKIPKKRGKKAEVETGVLTLTQMMSEDEVIVDKVDEKSYKLEPKFLIEPLNGKDRLSLRNRLYKLKPAYVVMYDADVAFIRQIEVYKATHPEIPLHLHFLTYENSAEEQRYLTSLKREIQAFEMLIRQKGEMVIPEERDGKGEGDLVRGSQKANETVNPVSSRQGGGARFEENKPSQKQKIIVDIREFRSELPSLIHRRGIDIEPTTIEVGDYILTPDICVERKSVGDLIGSLNNGRLYTQATAMSRFYKTPVLLIEFDAGKPFILRGNYDMPRDVISHDYVSKLLLLTLHFPKLKILWCSSPYATAEIFEDLKADKGQPDVMEAKKIAETVTNELGVDSNIEKYNSAPKDFLMLMPGVDTKNCRVIMNKCGSLANLAENWPEERIKELLGHSSNAENLYKSIHEPLTKLGDKVISGKQNSFKNRGRFRKKTTVK